MLHHRTTDPAARAWHIAERESEVQFAKTGNVADLITGCLEMYDGYLPEFLEEAEIEATEKARGGSEVVRTNKAVTIKAHHASEKMKKGENDGS